MVHLVFLSKSFYHSSFEWYKKIRKILGSHSFVGSVFFLSVSDI